MNQLIKKIIRKARKIKRKKFQKISIVCCYGIGDIFLLCSIVKKHNEKNYEIVTTKKLAKICRDVFGINNVKVLNLKDKLIIKKYNKMEYKKNYVLFNLQFRKNKFLFNYFTYKNLNMLDLYKIILKLPPDYVLYKPKINNIVYKEIANKYKKLYTSKAVIIAPDANSMFAIDDSFWEELIEELIKNNYTILMNSNRFKNKNVISIKPDFIDLMVLSDVVGWVIALRSGICDLLSASNCYLSIIYNKEYRMDERKARKYYSVKEIYNRDNINEYCIGNTKELDKVIINDRNKHEKN